MVVNSNESARTACDRPDSASASKPSTSILMNAGTPCFAISASSVVTSSSTDLAPALGLPAGRAIVRPPRTPKRPTTPSDCRIDQHARPARLVAPTATASIVTGLVAAIEQPKRAHHRPLRLDRDDSGAEPAERGNTIADMCADIEHQISGSNEIAIEPVHRRGALAVPIIDAKGPDAWRALSGSA